MEDAPIDLERFRKVALLFDAKRETFESDAFADLALYVVGRLARTLAPPASGKGRRIEAADIQRFCRLLLQDKPDAALSFIESRRAEGLSRERIYLEYIGAAARRLGALWDEDALSFVDVTIGSVHLYAILRAMRLETAWTTAPGGPRRRALFATTPGEEHGLGVAVAAEIFRDAGWEIDLRTGEDHDDLVELIETSKPPIVGLSLSDKRKLDALVRLVVATRIAAPAATIGLGLGEGIDADQVRNLVDVDLFFGDATSALSQLEQIISPSSRRAGAT